MEENKIRPVRFLIHPRVTRLCSLLSLLSVKSQIHGHWLKKKPHTTTPNPPDTVTTPHSIYAEAQPNQTSYSAQLSPAQPLLPPVPPLPPGMEEREENMDDANTEEHKDVTDDIDDNNLSQTHDHVLVEEEQGKNPDPVDNVESETHDSVKDSEAQVGSTPTGTKSSEDAENPAKLSVEVKVNSENGCLVSNVDTGASHKGEVSVVIEKEGDDDVKGEEKKDGMSSKLGLSSVTKVKEQETKNQLNGRHEVGIKSSEAERGFHWETETFGGDESGTEEEQAAFMKEVETVYREKYLEWKPPKFYKEELNLLKLWRAVIKLGGYEQVTSCKLWRQVGESFKPPKTCTTVSWTFRNFYEKALLEYEKYKLHGDELPLPVEPARVENQASGSQALGTGRALRDAAARAMQGWHSRRILSNGEVGDPIIKDKSLNSMVKSDPKHHKSSGLLKRKKPPSLVSTVQVAHVKTTNSQSDIMVFDVGPPADWVKVNVHSFDDCFEVYALVPGFLREEVHVQSDPVGRLVISGQPAQLDNPWGVTPFKKVVSLSSRIDPHHTSAVVTLNGQLFVHVPFEQSDL